MRISINLATHPFVELRPLFARLRIAMAGLAVLAIGLGVGLHYLTVRARVAEAQMDALKAQTVAVETERQTNERRMQQPQNRAVLDRSKFLNALFRAKSFSWTAVMMDLERVLPAGVQVTSIEPIIAPEGDVSIRLRVSGDRDREVDLVRNLEQSQRFLQPRVSNETAQTQEGKSGPAVAVGVPGTVEFEILSGYNPLTAKSVDKEKPKKDETSGSKSAKPAGNGPAVHKSAGNKPAGNKPANKAVAAPGGTR
jgi:type IV pilus assembly protein PilN